MLIILDDDHSYLSWIAHHRSGFVLDARRKSTPKQLLLHRALCPAIRMSTGRRTRWTTGARLKACSLDPAELAAWARGATGADPGFCPRCQPQQELGPEALDSLSEPRRRKSLSPLARRLLDYVLDVALISLEQGRSYSVRVEEVAAALAKRNGEIGTALVRLLADGYLTTNGRLVPGAPLAGEAALYPTAGALRTLPAYADWSDDEIEAELTRLTGGQG